MKTFLKIFKDSAYNPFFYTTIPSIPAKKVFKDYFKIAVFLSFVMTLVFSAFLVPRGVSFVKDDAPMLVKEYYPSELEINIEKGQASANVPMPYFIPAKHEGTPPANSQIENILVIDTENNFDTKKFDEYKTYALLTKTDLVTQDSSGSITIKSVNTLPSGVINQDKLLSWVGKVDGALVYVVPVVILLMFVLFFLGYSLYLIPLFFFALITFLISWVKKAPTLTYGNAYKISMYAIVPSLVLKSFLNMVGFLFVPPYLTLFVFLLVVSLNMRENQTLTSSAQ
ncbi:MAG: DUF1189 family protein [Candidatus Pacebacteria bacterium]|nr:DUF1189 family protein [Candidatus Paceibacterota bacterium]